MVTKDPYRTEQLSVHPEEEGFRVDRLIAARLEISRSHALKLINDGCVLLDGVCPQPSRRLLPGQTIEVNWDGGAIQPTPLPLSILYQDDDLISVDKPSGMPVHPANATDTRATLVSTLLAFTTLAGGPQLRPGVVHRLDAPTSGVIVLSRTEEAHTGLAAQFQDRTVEKVYLAVVEGPLEVEEGTVDGRIGRDPRQPWRMAISSNGRPARTDIRVLGRQEGKTLLEVHPWTGRTHQIRVHLAAIGHPVQGDHVYGQRGDRLMLHALRLAFTHPRTEARLQLEAPPPEPFAPWHEHIGNSSRP